MSEVNSVGPLAGPPAAASPAAPKDHNIQLSTCWRWVGGSVWRGGEGRGVRPRKREGEKGRGRERERDRGEGKRLTVCSSVFGLVQLYSRFRYDLLLRCLHKVIGTVLTSNGCNKLEVPYRSLAQVLLRQDR